MRWPNLQRIQFGKPAPTVNPATVASPEILPISPRRCVFSLDKSLSWMDIVPNPAEASVRQSTSRAFSVKLTAAASTSDCPRHPTEAQFGRLLDRQYPCQLVSRHPDRGRRRRVPDSGRTSRGAHVHSSRYDKRSTAEAWPSWPIRPVEVSLCDTCPQRFGK